jgi:hypothetical protein
VWNHPVSLALDSFGYEQSRGASQGERYAAYADLMRKFRKESKAPDMLVLDCFFYNIGSKLIKIQNG